MCRLKGKKDRVRKASGSPGDAPPGRRGRPARSRKRRLLRLYLCTPEAEVSLKKILELLAEGLFQPKARHTQCLLNDMLSKPYRQKRPKDSTAMAERLEYLRSIRDGRLQQTDPSAAPRREVVKECAILLRRNSGGKPKNNSDPPVVARDTSGEPEDRPDGESLGSPVAAAVDQRPDTASSDPSRGLLVTAGGGEPRTSLSQGSDGIMDVRQGLGPEIFKNPWGVSESNWEEAKAERIEFLRERFPSRSSSFLADVASLLSGLSIRSSISRSSSGSSRRSVRSADSRVEPSGSESGRED